MIDRTVIDELQKFSEKGRFMRGLIAWVGFNQISVLYERDPRFAGVTKYSLRKMVSFAIEGLTNFSRRRETCYFHGSLFFFIIIFWHSLCFIHKVIDANWVAGWAAICMTILLSSGIQLIFIGLLGEYIGNIFFETKNRPLYIVEEKKVLNKSK